MRLIIFCNINKTLQIFYCLSSFADIFGIEPSKLDISSCFHGGCMSFSCILNDFDTKTWKFPLKSRFKKPVKQPCLFVVVFPQIKPFLFLKFCKASNSKEAKTNASFLLTNFYAVDISNESQKMRLIERQRH